MKLFTVRVNIPSVVAGSICSVTNEDEGGDINITEVTVEATEVETETPTETSEVETEASTGA